jgi:hypothetical protein
MKLKIQALDHRLKFVVCHPQVTFSVGDAVVVELVHSEHNMYYVYCYLIRWNTCNCEIFFFSLVRNLARKERPLVVEWSYLPFVWRPDGLSRGMRARDD